MKEVCISQGTAVTFYRYGGLAYNSSCKMSSGFYIPKVIKISSFLTWVTKKYKCCHFLETWWSYERISGILCTSFVIVNGKVKGNHLAQINLALMRPNTQTRQYSKRVILTASIFNDNISKHKPLNCNQNAICYYSLLSWGTGFSQQQSIN